MRRALLSSFLVAALAGGAAAAAGLATDARSERLAREAIARRLDEAAAVASSSLDALWAREAQRTAARCTMVAAWFSDEGASAAVEHVLDPDDAFRYTRVSFFSRPSVEVAWSRLATAERPDARGTPTPAEPDAPSATPPPVADPSRSSGPLVVVDRARDRIECWDASRTAAIVVSVARGHLAPEWPPGGPTIERLDPAEARPAHIAELRWLEEPTPGAPRLAVVLERDAERSARSGAPEWALYAALFAALGAVLGAWLGGGRGAAPVASAALAAAAERVGKGDLDVTLSGAEGDATVSAFNRMTRDLREARARATRAERVAAWRETARRVAHEIKNPLTPIRMAIETLRKARARNHPDEAEIFEESTRAVLEEVNRLDRIVSDFGKFAKLPRPKAQDVDVRELAAHVVSLAGLPSDVTATDGAQKTEVELVAPGEVPVVRADREQLSQVLTNLVHNAMDAARAAHAGGGHVVVSLARSDAGGVRISVEDDGPGIASEDREKVLEPYFTTKPTGTGLGLAIVDRIVSEHEGTLVFGRSETLGGAAVLVTLRREGPSESGESSRPSAP